VRDRITIAILALGGQGGGVLADWILEAGRASGYRTQGTSVPGVAQRTGTTVYYIEMTPDNGAGEPVLALMPVPGDVDVVIASELMESGRAILRGFVSKDRTTLIASTHRVYSIQEKSAPGDGIARGDRVLQAAGERARRFVGFDMDALATRSGSVISSVMLGALAGSEALPIPRPVFEAVIRESGIAVAANLKGFEAGLAAAAMPSPEPAAEEAVPPSPTTTAGRLLAERVAREVPAEARTLALIGVARLMDYQDEAYAALYLDRLAGIGSADGDLAAAVARHLALWMSYEDTIRVADLKTRGLRFARVRTEVGAEAGQVVGVTEFMHPRVQELCETLPAPLGAWLLASSWPRRLLERLFARGRHVETTSLRWFLILSSLAALRRFRRATLRYRHEQQRIEAWIGVVARIAPRNPGLAAEIALCQRLVKGYGETFERGLRKFDTVMSAAAGLDGRPDGADRVRELREAALADEDGAALGDAIARLGLSESVDARVRGSR